MPVQPNDRTNELWHRTWPWIAAQLDRFIPTARQEGNPDELRRLRLIVGIQLITLLLVPIPIVVHWQAGRTGLAAMMAINEVTISCLLIGIRYGLTSTIAGQGLSATVMATTVFTAMSYGGVHSPPAIAIVIIPFIHTMFVRGWTNWLWFGFGVVAFIALGSYSTGAAAEIREKTGALVTVMLVLTASISLFEVSRRENLASLTRSQAKAEAAAEAKSRFLANMSHEIRTPLNGVLGMLGILLETRLEKDQHEYAQTAHSSGVVLLDLINDILDFSKIEAGQMLLDATPFDLRALVEDVLDQVAVLAGEKDVELISRYVPETPTHVVGDPGRLRQIMLNLVNNAVKFTHEGHVLVTVEEVESSGNRPMFRCSVEDTGMGIAPAQQARVFEHFQQVDASPSRVHAGTGLGLAIVRELTTLMDGRVGLTSEVGKGSTFWFELPLPVARIPTQSRPQSLRGLRLLVVDDNRVNRWVLQEQLARWDFRLEEAASGARALQLLREAAERGEPFDIALLDYHMPRMDGLELTRLIKADESIKGTLLVMLSSVTYRSASQKLLEAGCAAYLIKPVHQSDLMNTLINTWDDCRVTSRPRAEEVFAGHEPGMAIAKGSRILVVEDNAVNQKVAVRMLTTLGAYVDVAGDGIEAVAQVESLPYDLVFMDVQMPRMDGLEATREIRQREGSKGTRLTIVAMTAHAQSEDRDRCLDAGMDGYVRKPITRRELIRTLREHLVPREPSSSESSVRTPPVENSPSAPDPCDLAWLRANYDPSDEVLAELLGLFMQQSSELLAEMGAQLAAKDDEGFARSTHTLKGLSGTVRATVMHELVGGRPEEVVARMPELRRAYAELGVFLGRTFDLRVPALER